MRIAIVVGIVLVGGLAHADPALRGTVRVAPRGHCGGAYIKDYQPPQPVPAAGVKLLVRKGGKNSEKKPIELTTDASGEFSADLPKGRYCIVLAEKRRKPRKGSKYVDLKCAVADWSRCDAIADVPVATPVTIDHYTSCFGPCYHGPTPP